MMEDGTYYLDTGNGRVYFTVTGGIVHRREQDTKVRVYEFSHFIAIARELGLKAGKV